MQDAMSLRPRLLAIIERISCRSRACVWNIQPQKMRNRTSLTGMTTKTIMTTSQECSNNKRGKRRTEKLGSRNELEMISKRTATLQRILRLLQDNMLPWHTDYKQREFQKGQHNAGVGGETKGKSVR